MKGAAILLCGLALACGRSSQSPETVVTGYFRSLGADPMRTLSATSEAFHRSHGLRLAATPADPSSIDRQQLAWLAVQREPEFFELARSLSITPISAEAGDESARVVVRVATAADEIPPFEQRFALVRDSLGWRIDSVTQMGVTSAAAAAAYAAYPSRETRARLASESRRERP